MRQDRSTRPKIRMPTAAEDREITAAALSDPDAQPLTDEELAQFVPIKVLLGRPPKASPKQLVSVRFNPDVIAWFKSTGRGWQTRMDSVLVDYVSQRGR